MAQERRITVESVEERTSQNGKTYWRVKAAGEARSYFVWDSELAQALVPGCTYQATINGTSDYPRIADVTLVPDTAPAASTPADTRERRMLRMSALRAASEVLHGTSVAADELLAYADALLRWLES